MFFALPVFGSTLTAVLASLAAITAGDRHRALTGFGLGPPDRLEAVRSLADVNFAALEISQRKPNSEAGNPVKAAVSISGRYGVLRGCSHATCGMSDRLIPRSASSRSLRPESSRTVTPYCRQAWR